jgi:prepilin-type N-terminal cleavage/methylation domain-containing protein
MLRKLLKDEAGFTLIELLIVVVIIGILAAVGIPIYSRYISSAKASEAPTIMMALVEYIGSYSRAHPESWTTTGLLTGTADVGITGQPGNDGSTTDWVNEVVGNDNEYFTYSWTGSDSTRILTAAGDGDPFSTTDTMSVRIATDGSIDRTYGTNGWSAAGRLVDVVPD